MKILIINCILTTPVDGRVVRLQTNHDCMIYSMARGFAALGHEVTLAASADYEPAQLPEQEPFEIRYFPSRLPAVFRPTLFPWPKGLAKYLRREGPGFDMVVASEVFMVPSLLAARILPERLVVWQEMGMYQRMMKELPAKIWYRAVVPMLMPNVRVIARSQPARDFISRHCRHVCGEIVDHGTNGEIFYPADTAPERRFIVVSVLVPRKRIDTIICKFARFVKAGHADFMLDIVGDGPEKGALQEAARREGVADNVIFHGKLSHQEFAPLSRRAVAMLVNTRRDLNMVSIPESVTNGTPVLMNCVPTTAPFVAAENLGIAKDDWDERDMEQMVARYDEFHANCCRVRDSLTNVGCASKMISLFESTF